MTPSLLNQLTHGAFAGSTKFPETVQRMLADGVEWYSANLVFGMKTHYAADLSHHQTPWPNYAPLPIADRFSADDVEAAIHASQQGRISYPEFLERIAAAGVVYYTVHLQGRKALYFGRHGEFHLEPFPQ